MIDIFKELLKPENRSLLGILLALAVLLATAFMLLAVYAAKKWRLNFRFGPIVLDGSAAASNLNPLDLKTPAPPIRRYRKVQYVKVVYLSEKSSATVPFYGRLVERLEEQERIVPVFDEAVYYMLELFPTKQMLASRADRSSGVVDSRMVIPWKDQLVFRDADSRFVKQLVQMEANEESDTLLTVSHFENGLQGNNQDFATDVPEDAEYVRLIVDFSSVPNASLFITPKSACVVGVDGREQIAAMAPYGDAMFMLLRENAKRGELLKMRFALDWSKSREHAERVRVSS